jgi:Ca-activated chloride channel family protein
VRRFVFFLVVLSVVTPISTAGALVQQSAPAVYVVAVKGECVNSQQPYAIVNGRMALLPATAAPMVAPSSKQTFLTRFADDAPAKALAEAELRKSRAIRLVDRIEDANFVFHVCSSYWGEFVSGQMNINGLGIGPGYRIAVCSIVVPAAKFDPKTDAYTGMQQSALWKADSLTEKDQKTPKGRGPQMAGGMIQGNGGIAISFGGPVPDEVSPAEQAQRFLKESKNMMKQLAALPFPARSAASAEREVRRPTLVGGREDEAKATASTEAKPAEDDSTLKIDTSLVVVPVSVLDRHGKYLPDLKSDNFQIYENGIEQEISDFGSTETPFHVALLLDMSGSTHFRVEEIQDAALAFVNKLQPQDRVMVVAFDNSVRVAAEFTNDREQLMRAVLRTRNGGSTRVYDSLDLVLTERFARISGRKAIVIFSDGVDTSSRLATKEQILEHVEESGTLVYSIRYDTLAPIEAGRAVVNPGGQRAPLPVPTRNQLKIEYEDAVKYLQDLSRHSGGRYYDVDTITDTQQAFTGIAEELRRQYWIGYYPSNQARDGSYRKIRVAVDQPEAAIRAREGYRAQDNKK